MTAPTTAMGARVITDLPPSARSRWHVDQMVTKDIDVDGRTATYASGGRGLPVLFLHGWGLDHRAYQRSLRRLTARGCRVIAPSLPGFGGTAALPAARRNIEGYAAWVDAFVDAVGVTDPMVVLGHSFGGGVATKFVHDHPDRARYLVAVNSVGDPRVFVGNVLSRMVDVNAKNMFDPMIQFMLPNSTGATARLIPRIFVGNVLRDPRAMADAARVAMTADLSGEMATLAERGVPTLVLWSDGDGVIPMSAFDTFCSTFGSDGHVVAGGHSWLLARPDVFGQVLDNVVQMQKTQHYEQVATASTSRLRTLLGTTTLPPAATRRLLAGASPLWVLSAPPTVLAGDLALCHPRLRKNEVRAVARAMREPTMYRLTVVARDRPGLLADTAGILASVGASVVFASAMTWPGDQTALHALTVRCDAGLDQQQWALIGERLRAVTTGLPAVTRFVPTGRADVIVTGEGDGRSVVRVTAPDRIGLLSAVCRWFADNEMSVEAASISTVDGVAKDVFLVDGDCDVEGLARHLSAPRTNALSALASALCPFHR
jgi:pimeloyl-ACP methyl ester carboxylesterase/predicted amino acid-binding ACT domain protein